MVEVYRYQDFFFFAGIVEEFKHQRLVVDVKTNSRVDLNAKHSVESCGSVKGVHSCFTSKTAQHTLYSDRTSRTTAPV